VYTCSRRFVARFEAIRGLTRQGDIAIDDFSLTPECFGLGTSRLCLYKLFIYLFISKSHTKYTKKHTNNKTHNKD